MWCYSSNVIGNQHADLNKTHQILTDESECEFILVWDNHNTASAKYADLLLPDVTLVEADDLINNSYTSGFYHYLVRLQQAIKLLWQNRPCYDVLAEIAEKLGVVAEFTEGRTYQQWIEHCYNKTRELMPHLPPFAQTNDQGIIDRRLADSDQQITLKDFRLDPDKYPLKTPSGKIEIYSEQLNKIVQEWQLSDGDRIPYIPEYYANREGVENVDSKKKYPLQMTGFYNKGHVHSSYYSVSMLREAIPHQFWINPIDAKMRDLKQGDIAKIYNDRGRIYQN